MKAKTVALTAILLLFATAIIAFPQKYISVCLEGFCTWAECVLPSLFPFMVITAILIKTGVATSAAKPFTKVCARVNMPQNALPLFLMSVFSGYPAGSRMVCEYKRGGMITEYDCKKLAPLCSTAGPLFICGTVGYKAFGGGAAGAKLLCACLLSVISTSLIYSLTRKNKKITATPLIAQQKQADVLYDSFYGAVVAVCMAGGFIAFFYTLARVLQDCKVLAPVTVICTPLFGEGCASAVAIGLCEATCGCFALAGSGGFFALPLAGFLITFGGASIIAQQMCYLSECGVKSLFFIAFKFIQGTVCFAVLCLLSLW